MNRRRRAALYAYLRDNHLAFAKWQEEEGLLTLNNANHFAGAGSYGFTDELPSGGCARTGQITTNDLWLNINSQETGEYLPAHVPRIHPAQLRRYCEGVWLGLLRLLRTDSHESGTVASASCLTCARFPFQRGVTKNAWVKHCEAAATIYSRKPSPNFIGVGTEFDE